MAAKKKFSWIKWLVILAIIGGGTAYGVQRYRKPAAKPIDYRSANVSSGQIVQSVTANGQLTPIKTVEVGSQISGIILELKADFNSKVKAGDIVAQIDPATYQQNVSQAEAELQNSAASLELAELNYRRAVELRKSELIAVSEADQAAATLSQAKASMSIRSAAVEKAKVDLSRTTIYAPIDGLVISRNVDVGQTVAASLSAPTLFLIANDLAKMQIYAMVSEADVGGVEENQRVTFTVDAFPTRQFEGVIKQVRFLPTTNQNVVTYTTIVEVNNADLKLRPGMTANASIITAERPNVVKIANAALRFRPPEGANVKTNIVAKASGGTNDVAKGTNTVASTDGPSPFGGGEGGPPNRDEMRRRFENMTPEQREEMRARFGRGEGGGPGRFGGGNRQSRPDRPATATVYKLIKEKQPTGEEIQMLEPVTIKTGISDGAFTEVIEGLKDGDVIVTGLNLVADASGGAARPATSQPGAVNNPFGGGGGGFRPR